MRLPTPRPLAPQIPVAAVANIGLLIAFFFILSATYAPGRDTINLPAAPGRRDAPPGSACLIVERRVGPAMGEELQWHFSERNGEVHALVGPEALYFEASRIVDADPERTFVLRIDADVRYAIVDSVLETLRKAGVRNIVFGTRDPSTGSGQGA